MGLSAKQQMQIQAQIDQADLANLESLRTTAETTLHELSFAAEVMVLDTAETERGLLAIEMITRIEAKEQNGGWWFRAKKRAHLTQVYFKP